MTLVDKDLQVPVVIHKTKKHCNVYVPDFNITIHGDDYIDSIASAIASVSAIYYYNLERNSHIPLTTSYEDAEKMCDKRGSFATFIYLLA